jgi:type II secretory pathway pseudopilin PulG
VSHRARWWRILEDEEGLGLIEVMAAIFVLAVALMALASVATTSLVSLRISRDREQATNAASAAIESVRSRDFTGIAHDLGAVDPSRLPDGALPAGSTATCFDGEPVVTDAVVDPVPFEQTAGNNDAITVHTVVTYEDGDCTTGARTDLKRVTVVASWQDQGNVRFVQQETLVALVDRGLPVPKFEVRPQEAAAYFSHAFLSDPAQSDERRCIPHQLRNLGAVDSYDWELAAASESPIAQSATHNAYEVGDWRVTAHLEYDDPMPAPRGNLPPPDDSWKFRYEAGFDRLVSDERVEPGEMALLTICYEPRVPVTSDAGPFPPSITTEVVIRSRFDERQARSVFHTVDVINQAAPGRALYLFDRDDTTRHDRRYPKPTNPNQGTLIYGPSVMGPLAPDGADPSLVNNLSSHDYRPEVANWSTEIVPDDDLAGIRLLRPDTSDRNVSPTTAAWHYQFPSSTDLLRQANLELWVAPVSALDGMPVPAEGLPMSLEIRLDGLGSNETNVTWTGTTTTYTYTHTTNSTSNDGWQRQLIPLDLGGNVSFAANRYLRLRVTCAPSNGEDCNIAYDNVKFASALYVQVR